MAEQVSWQRELAQLRERVESLAVQQVRLEQNLDTLVATVAAERAQREEKQGVRY